MKKLYTLLFIATTTLSIAQNLVVNPTFADGLNGWSSSGSYTLPNHITNDGQDDSFSVQYVATATTGFDQRFNVVEGSTVTVSFWYKAARTDGATTGNTGRIWSVFTANSSSTTPINPPGTTGNGDDPLRNNNSYLPQATTWTFVTITSEVPTGATNFILQFRAYNGATVSFDNIYFNSPGATLSSSSFNSSVDGLKMYPNPVSGNTLYINTTANAVKQVQVYDVLGKQIINTTVTNNSLNVANLNAGVYIVRITEEGKTATRKLVVK